MKKLLLLSLFLVVLFSSLLQADSARWVHEWTVDLYYANGVLADEQKLEKFDWKRRTKLLKQKHPSLNQALRFGEAKLAYNASYLWGISDLTEVILQYGAEHPAAEVTWQALSFFLKKKLKIDLGDLMERLGKITSEYTISEQMKAYEESVRNGHGVITVAHSQGNFFTNEVFKRIATMPKTSWMKPYLHMIGVAPPSTEVFGGGPHVLFDNDTIAVLQAQSVTHHNPYRAQFRNALGETVDDFSVAFHSFAYYMGEEVKYTDGFGTHR